MTVADVWKQKQPGAEADARSRDPTTCSGSADSDAEEALVRRCLAGDRPAFDALVLAYRTRVYALARLALGSAEDAHDVAQETFVRAYEALPRYRHRGLFRVWIYTIAANLCRNRLKARRPVISWEEPGMAAELIDPTPGPEAAALDRERAKAVREAIAQMGDRDRLMVILYYQDDLSLQEIARIVGCRAGAVKVALHRARHRLREQLQRQGFIESSPQEKEQ
jgi:RNA polymerase sigma-70 factor (ECF subfamily)